MNGDEARSLVPPRPNLGPEPWREPDRTAGILLAATFAAAIVLVAALWLRRRRAVGRAGGRAAAVGLVSSEPTTRERLVGLSESIREALTAQFGAACRAKTTQELSVDDRLSRLLGEDDFRDLIRFLDQIDLLKFAPERSDNHHEALKEVLSAWEPRVATLSGRIRARPRTRPKRSEPSRGKAGA